MKEERKRNEPLAEIKKFYFCAPEVDGKRPGIYSKWGASYTIQ